ncbi:hypothetical protein L3V82_04010 [Thiotrichales bacterium 19S3-7]|nr:hypothetical protein [Thiotrichales bacterium 19S3-7]MCF6801839.1 hypothetical protein [Thiotrichales bacterium 19S3-11]
MYDEMKKNDAAEKKESLLGKRSFSSQEVTTSYEGGPEKRPKRFTMAPLETSDTPSFCWVRVTTNKNTK